MSFLSRFFINNMKRHDALQSPIEKFHVIEPSDTNNLPEEVRGIYVTQSGYLNIQLELDTVPTRIPVHEAQLLPFMAIKIYATGTDAIVVGVS